MATLGETFAAQLCHQRRQYKPSGNRLPYKPRESIARMHNIGIGEQEIFRLQSFGSVDALLDRP